MTFKPLLASPADMDLLTFPLIASPKIDGIRCLIDPVLGAVSRTLKPILNRYVRGILANASAYLDGELVTYTDGRIDDFNTVQSKIMSEDGKPEFKFHAFDYFEKPELPYTSRLAALIDAMGTVPEVVAHTYEFVGYAEQLSEIESRYIDDLGWEGVMLRSPDGRYKYGRSTAREQILLKVKRFVDSEAVIVGTIEKMHNGNEAVTNALGHTERSTAKAGLVPAGTLGALSVEWNGVRFEIGTGFDDATRADMWTRRDALIGRSVTFKYQGVGSQGAPRFPVFLGLRYDLEIAA